MSNVRQLNVTPKKETRLYKRHEITVQFQPSNKEWSWRFKHTATVTFAGTAKTIDKAYRAAKKEVDRIVENTT